jgi:hypothetical protein
MIAFERLIFASCPPEERVNLSLTNSGPSRTVPYGRAVSIGELVGTRRLRLPAFTDKQTASEPGRTSLEGQRTCMGRLVSRLFVMGHLLVRPGCDISSSRPVFARLLRAAAVKGGRRPSRSDLPLTAASTAADLRDRGGLRLATEDDTEGELAIVRADRAPRTCIRPTREDRNHDADPMQAQRAERCTS